MMTDPVADMLTRVRNAIAARHGQVEVPLSNLKLHIAEVLRDEGYIVGLEVHGTAPKQMLRIELKYFGKREPVLTGLRRVSRPGRRVYAKVTEIPRVFGGLGTPILSTPQGVVSGRKARRLNVGGEVLAEVW
jgi:small subunit ribosomal protein S8